MVYVNNVLSFGVAHQCIKIGNYSTMQKDWIYLSKVLGLGIAQQFVNVEYTITMF